MSVGQFWEVLWDKLGEQVAGVFSCRLFLWGCHLSEHYYSESEESKIFMLSFENKLLIAYQPSNTFSCRKIEKYRKV